MQEQGVKKKNKEQSVAELAELGKYEEAGELAKLGKYEEAGDKFIELWDTLHADDETEDNYPTYPEKVLAAIDRRRKRELSIEDVYTATVGATESTESLFEVYWCELRAGAIKAGCTERQIEILSWRKYGLSYIDIADITGYSKSTIARDLKKAVDMISDDIDLFGLWTVLAEVFRENIYWIKELMLRSKK